jgi:transposase
MRETYPSDITRESFELIKAELLAATQPMQKRKYDIYDVFCAVLYVLKEGCSWRAIPHDFPKWQNCYYHFLIWKKEDETGETLIDRLLRRLVISVRNDDCRTDKTTMIIVDSMSVQNTDLPEQKGYDAGKKLQG